MEENTTNDAKLKLLLVEDEPFLRDLLSMKFGSEDIELLHAQDGGEVVPMAEEGQPQVILLDLVLPSMSGFEILEQLKANDATKDIPVIILSNLGQDEDRERGMKLGAKAFLVKAHSSPSVIIAKVRAVVAGDAV